MKRRKFLSLASAGVAAALSAEGSTSARAFGEHPDAVGVLYDSTLCIGCRSCEAACRTVNSAVLPEPEQYRIPEKPFYDRSVLATKRRLDFQRYTVVNRYTAEGRALPVYRKVQCNHCLDPACASACFVKAMRKTKEGPVSYRPDLCVGCRYCMVACPFYVPTYDYHNAAKPLIYKCTMCAPLIASGQAPGCVAQCPEKALIFDNRRTLLSIAKERIRNAPAQYVDHIYGEHEAGGTSWLYLSPISHERLDQPAPGNTPPAALTAGVLSVAGAAAGVLSVFLGAACFISGRREKNATRRLGETDAGENPAERERGNGIFAGQAGGQVMTPEHTRVSGPKGVVKKSVVAVILLTGLVLTLLRFTQGIGGVSNLDDMTPWGFWTAFDLLCGIALSAGGAAVAVAYYVFGVKEFSVQVRAALATAFLGYFFEVVALVFEVGQPWRLVYIFLSPGTTSVLFLVGLCVFFYLTVMALELLPAFFKSLGRHGARVKSARPAVVLAVIGAVIAVIHQSSLGALYLIVPSKMHPLWYSAYMPFFFLLSAVFAGLSMVVVEGRLTHRFISSHMDVEHMRNADRAALVCGRIAPVVMLLYLFAKCMELGMAGVFPHLASGCGAWFALELAGGVALPALLYIFGAKRENMCLIRTAAALTVLGVVVNRFNVSIVAFNYNLSSAERYSPSWMEIAISVFLVTLLIMAYRFMCAALPILRGHEGE